MRVFLIVMLLLSPLGAAAQTSESDRGYIQGLLEDALSAPGRQVRMQGFAGALSSRATIEQITVSDPDGIWITISDVALVWARRALLSGRIEIEEISVGRIDLPRPPLPAETDLPAPEAKGSFALPELPVAVNIATMRIDRAELGQALFGQAAVIGLEGAAALEGGQGQADLTITRRDQPGQFTLSGRFDNATQQLQLTLDLEEPEDGIAANLLNLPGLPSVKMRVEGDDPLQDFTANLALATDGQPRLSGTVTLESDAESARFSADLGGDLAPVLAPQYRAFLGEAVQLRASGSRDASGAMDLTALDLSAAALRLQGAGALAADGWPERLDLTGQIAPVSGDSVVLPLPGAPISVGAVSLKARFDAAQGESWQITGRADRVAQDALQIGSAGFEAQGQLSRGDGRVFGRMDLEAAGLRFADPALARAVGQALRGGFDFDWRKTAPLDLRNLDLSGADYGLTGQLNVAGLEEISALTLTPALTLTARDISRFSDLAGQALQGSARLDVTGALEPLTGQMDLTLAGRTTDLATGIAQLDPLIIGPGQLRLRVLRDETGTRLDPARIETDHASIKATATLASGASRIALDAALPDVARALPQLSGAARLVGNATQQGTLWDVTLNADLPGETQLRYDGRFAGDGQTTLTTDGKLTAQIDRLAAFSRLAGIGLSGAATLEATAKGNLLTGALDVTAAGETAGFGTDLDVVQTLLGGRTRFDLAAGRQSDGVIDIRVLALEGSGLTGLVDGRFGPGGTLNYRLNLTDLGRLVADLPGPARITGSATEQNGNWRVRADGTGPGGIAAEMRGQVAGDASRLDLALSGNAPLALANRRLNGQSLDGRARFDLAVNGPPALSSVSGRVALDGARLALPAQKLALENITGGVDLAGGRAAVGLAARLSDGGDLRLSGPISLSAPFVADLALTLRDATLRDATLYEARLRADLAVKGALSGGARIAGRIDLEEAELQIPQFGPSYSSLDGLKHIRASGPVRQTLRFAGLDQSADSASGGSGPDYPVDIALNAPNRIFVRGRGLDAELGGSLRVTGSSRNLIPQGSFELIRGRLDLLGRRLTLSEGNVWLRGSFDPVINFAATSTVEDVAVSLSLEGLASGPELTVTSVPDLPQDEALSYFLFGRDITSISALQAVQLAAALRTLSGKGGLGLTGQLREGLGVDDLDLGTDADGNTQARVGKYLSDNIYTDVTVNSDGTSQINLNLDLNDNVTVRGRTGSDGNSGLGVFFERDY